MRTGHSETSHRSLPANKPARIPRSEGGRGRVELLYLLVSPATDLLVTTASLVVGWRLLGIESATAFELMVVAVAIRLALWWWPTSAHLLTGRSRRGIATLLRDESLLGLGLLAAGFVRHWPIAVSSLLLLLGANLIGQTLIAVSIRLSSRILFRKSRSGGAAVTHRVIIVGTNLRARRFADRVLDHPEMRTGIFGFLDYERTGLWRYRDLPLLGHPRSFERAALGEHIDALVIAVGADEIGLTTSLFSNAERMGITVWFLPELYQPKLSSPRSTDSIGLPAIVYDPAQVNCLACGIKGAIDRIGAFLFMVAGFPLFLLTALSIKLDSPGPVFFKQERLGQNGRRFILYKFRTMACDAEKKKRALLSRNEMSGPVFKIKDDPRITRIGRLLRKFSVDEFPQLLNVLRGDMSLVGPRPPLSSEVNRFEPWQRRKLSVKPGLTCLWQVNGRNAIDFDHWMRLDLEYIDNWSLWLDTRILLKTVPTVLKGTGL